MRWRFRCKGYVTECSQVKPTREKQDKLKGRILSRKTRQVLDGMSDPLRTQERMNYLQNLACAMEPDICLLVPSQIFGSEGHLQGASPAFLGEVSACRSGQIAISIQLLQQVQDGHTRLIKGKLRKYLLASTAMSSLNGCLGQSPHLH